MHISNKMEMKGVMDFLVFSDVVNSSGLAVKSRRNQAQNTGGDSWSSFSSFVSFCLFSPSTEFIHKINVFLNVANLAPQASKCSKNKPTFKLTTEHVYIRNGSLNLKDFFFI